MSPRTQHLTLKLWHAWLAGGYLVAYVTADENTYAMHQFSGYAVLAAIVVRVLAGLAAPKGSPWRLPRPSLAAFAARRGRNPLFAWFAAALLISIAAAAAFGALADGITWLEHPHEALSEASLWIVLGHIAFVTFTYGGKRVLSRAINWLSAPRFSTLKDHTP